jgi:glycosyltransferase involved in cell wall biosynthesis
MGCPVVAFNHGGAVESIIPGVTGWLAEPGDVASLATAVKKALGLGKIARQKLALESRKHIETQFTSKFMCQSTIRLYLKLM